MTQKHSMQKLVETKLFRKLRGAHTALICSLGQLRQLLPQVRWRSFKEELARRRADQQQVLEAGRT